MSAEKERKMEDDLAGVQSGSKKSKADRYIMEFALMARKLRKGQVSGAGVASPDKYSNIIERQLARIDAAIELLENNPQLASEYGEDEDGVHEILSMIDRKAAELEKDEIFKNAADKIRVNLPGSTVNQLVKKYRDGGLAKADAGQLGFNRTKLFA
jgi:hypothetical protein